MTVVGGKLTTYRLMAERAADIVCAAIGRERACGTKEYVLPDRARADASSAQDAQAGASPGSIETRQTARLADLRVRAGHALGLEQAARAPCRHRAPWVLDDLRRDLRLGMGPCQGGFCGYRAAGILHEMGSLDAAQATAALADFAQRRWKGQRPLLWGQNLRQALLDEQIYRGILGLDRSGGRRDHG